MNICINIYIGLRWPPAATYNCAQVHHRSPAGTFTRVPGRCLRWSPTSQGPRWPPAYRYILIEVLHLYRCVTHTHTHPHSHTHTHSHKPTRTHTHTHTHTDTYTIYQTTPQIPPISASMRGPPCSGVYTNIYGPCSGLCSLSRRLVISIPSFWYLSSMMQKRPRTTGVGGRGGSP